MSRFGWLFLFMGVQCVSVWGASPPSEFILTQIIKKHVSKETNDRWMRTVSWISQPAAGGQKIEGAPRVKVSTWISPKRDREWVKIQSEDSNELWVGSRRVDETSLGYRILWSDSSAETVAALKNAQIPILTEKDLSAYTTEVEKRQAEKVRLLRVRAGSPDAAWAISNETGGPGIWVEKDVFNPLKLVLPAAKGLPAAEFRYSQFKSLLGVTIPKQIQTFSLEKADAAVAVLLEEVVEWTLPSESKDSAKFSKELSRISNSKAGWAPVAESQTEPVRRLVDQVVRWLR